MNPDTPAAPGGGPRPAAGGEPPALDTSVAHVARIYDYWLGGKDNYAVDREAGDAAVRAYPDLVRSVRSNRAFLARAVRYLAAEAGIRQYLDIGTGLPSANNTHEVAQAVDPRCRIVYVDNDPIVLTHARALLTSTPEGATDYIHADLRNAGTILEQAASTLDFSRPLAIMLLAVLHLIPDEDDPYKVVTSLLAAAPPGSYLTISHIASDIETAVGDARDRVDQFMPGRQTYRSHSEVMRFFDGLELVPPGLSRVQDWRPDSEIEAKSPSALWGGVGRKS